MSADLVETERKYDLANGQQLPDLSPALPEDCRLIVEAPISLEAQYFDTPDHRLLAEGVTLRRRTGGHDADWHLKVPEETWRTRLEIHRPLRRDIEDEPPPDLAALVFAHTRGSPLQPIARVCTTRRSVRVVDNNDSTLVEVSEDDVVAAIGSNVERRWREAEVEIQPDGRSIAKAIDFLFGASGIETSKASSKLACALGPLTAPLSRAEPRRDALGHRLQELTRVLVAQDLRVRRNEPDAVHDLRVTTRRLRSCLRTFKKAFEPGEVDHLEAELGWLSGVLGRARDAEVLAEHLADQVEHGLPDELRASVRAPLDTHLQAETADAKRSLDLAMVSRRYATLVEELTRTADEPPYRASTAPTCLLRALRHEARRVANRIRDARDLDGDARDRSLHRARKAAKRARYAAETLEPIHAHRAREASGYFEEVQELLGGRQDAVVARALLRKIALEPGPPAVDSLAAFGLGLLVADESAALQRIDDQLGHRRLHRRKLLAAAEL